MLDCGIFKLSLLRTWCAVLDADEANEEATVAAMVVAVVAAALCGPSEDGVGGNGGRFFGDDAREVDALCCVAWFSDVALLARESDPRSGMPSW